MRTPTLIIQLVSAVLFISSCSKKDSITKKQITPKPQILNLKKPDKILNDIAKGEFHSQTINSVHFKNFNDIPKIWYFEVFPNTNKIKTIRFNRNPNAPFLCEETTMYYKYKDNLIDEIESVRIDVCLAFKATILFKYNYENSVLISITAKGYYSDSIVVNKLMLVGENYFSYNPDGTIAEIYGDMRSVTEPLYGYGKTTLLYDSNKNVIEAKAEDFFSNTYDKKYTFEYDNNINPLKGVYIFSWVLSTLPNNGVESLLGPNFLSNNCIKSVKSENLNRPTPFPETKLFTSNKVNNKIIDFGSDPNYPFWFRNYIY
jgi:hypothetical protein